VQPCLTPELPDISAYLSALEERIVGQPLEHLMCYICSRSSASRCIMAATTTIRLPPKLRARLGVLAKQTGRSAHSLIVEAVERHAAYEEQIRTLVKEALVADAEVDETGEVYRAEDVHAWMQRLAVDGKAQRPKRWQR
jgi:predicted transcriptional regulator